MNSQPQIRIDLMMMKDGTAYLTSPQRPALRKLVPKDDGSDENSVHFVMTRFRIECETALL
jgi:hypothetical protein